MHKFIFSVLERAFHICWLRKWHSHIAIVVRPPGRKTLCMSLVICKGFFCLDTPAVIWRVFQFCKEIWFGLWSCYLRMAFLDGDNFCKAFAKIVPIQKNYIGSILHLSRSRGYHILQRNVKEYYNHYLLDFCLFFSHNKRVSIFLFCPAATVCHNVWPSYYYATFHFIVCT